METKISETKTPTGMKDLNASDVYLREYIFGIIKSCFHARGGIPIDTPIMELKSTISNLYGEFNKKVFEVNDFSGEKLMLRYDLTVPLARYVANNGLQNFRRYHIGKVYRRDNPQITHGRYREFYQCDFDIVGCDNNNIYDIEILALLHDVLSKLLYNRFTIKINYKDILYRIFYLSDISPNNYEIVASAIDKLDKKSKEEIYDELIKKDINIDKLKYYVEKLCYSGDIVQTYNFLISEDVIPENLRNKIKNLFDNLVFLGISQKFIFDPLLARGLDYYTGVIYEATYSDKEIMAYSIAGGGRYDNMIGLFSNHGKIPAIGLSIGIERIVIIYEKIYPKDLFIDKNKMGPFVYVASVKGNFINQKIKLCETLRSFGIWCEMSNHENPKMRQQYDEVFNKKIPYMIVIGECEIKNNTIQIKDINANQQTEYKLDDGIKYIHDKYKSLFRNI